MECLELVQVVEEGKGGRAGGLHDPAAQQHQRRVKSLYFRCEIRHNKVNVTIIITSQHFCWKSCGPAKSLHSIQGSCRMTYTIHVSSVQLASTADLMQCGPVRGICISFSLPFLHVVLSFN